MSFNLFRSVGIQAACAAVVCGTLCLAGCSQSRPAASEPTVSPWSYRNAEGVQIRTDHWTIYAATQDKRQVDDLGPFVEAAYQQYQRLVPAPATSRALTLYIFDTSAQWHDYARLMGLQDGHISIAGRLNGFAQKDTAAVYLSRERAFTLGTIGRVGMLEYLWLHDAGDAPLWVRQGLATMCEGFNAQQEGSILAPAKMVRTRYVFDPKYNGKRMNQLRVAIQKNWLYDLETLVAIEDFASSPNPQVSVEAYLAQVWALMVFVQEEPQYRKGFERMGRDLVDGSLPLKVQGYLAADDGRSPGAAAFHFYITDDLTTFQKKFTAWLMNYAKIIE